MQIPPAVSVTPGTAVAVLQPAVVVGTAAPAAPIEPARRVTAARTGGRGELTPRPAQRTSETAHARGRLVDLLV
jgi:hypothetical protein